MAETKTAAKKARAKTRSSKAKAKAPASRKAAETRVRAKAKSRNRGGAKSSSGGKSKTPANQSAPSKPELARKAVEDTAGEVGSKVAGVVGKAKVPLLAGSAALAGAAGGLALGARQSHHHRSGLGKVSSKDLTNAAKKVGEVGAQVGEVALEVRRARESTNGHAKAHRSPIEVVLQGLTQRRPRG